jgi:hypothetical protein
VRNEESHPYGQVNIDDYANGDGKKVRVYELTWSPATDALKKKQFATDATYASDRVAVNRKLRADLVDDALADPVLYIGRYRNHMQFPIMRAVEAVLHDFQSQDEVAIITHSLGSYMTYDTLLKMSRGERIMGERDYSAALVEDVIGHTNYVFMLANQLPLLELSEVTNPLSRKKSSAAALRPSAKYAYKTNHGPWRSGSKLPCRSTSLRSAIRTIFSVIRWMRVMFPVTAWHIATSSSASNARRS